MNDMIYFQHYMCFFCAKFMIMSAQTIYRATQSPILNYLLVPQTVPEVYITTKHPRES